MTGEVSNINGHVALFSDENKGSFEFSPLAILKLQGGV
jgi:hypothetical protein